MTVFLRSLDFGDTTIQNFCENSSSRVLKDFPILLLSSLPRRASSTIILLLEGRLVLLKFSLVGLSFIQTPWILVASMPSMFCIERQRTVSKSLNLFGDYRAKRAPKNIGDISYPCLVLWCSSRKSRKRLNSFSSVVLAIQQLYTP